MRCIGGSSGVKDGMGNEKIETQNVRHEEGNKESGEQIKKTKSWAEVTQSKKVNPVATQFEFSPPPTRSIMVDPPDDLLQEGFEKLKLCITGYFSKKTIPFHLLYSEARKAWDKSGLLKVSQKDERISVF